MENLHVPPLRQTHGQNVMMSTIFPVSQSDKGQPWSSCSWGWHQSQMGPLEAHAQPTPLVRLPLLLCLHRALPSISPQPQGRNGCRQDPVKYLPPSSSHLISYRQGGYHNCQGSVLGAVNAEISQIRLTKFLGPQEKGHVKETRDGLLSSPTY